MTETLSGVEFKKPIVLCVVQYIQPEVIQLVLSAMYSQSH